MTATDALDRDDRAHHPSLAAPRPYRRGGKRRIEGLPERLPDAVTAYFDVLPEGRVVGFNLAGLDRTGIPVWFVALFLDDPFYVGAMPSGIGYGATDDEALIGAVAEIAENLMPSVALLPRKGENQAAVSYADLVRVYGATSVADPLTLCLPAGSPVGRDTPLDWTKSIRARTGESVWMPLDIAATDYFELRQGYQPFTNLITNGLGAGPDVAFALGHGLLELLQRDGNGLLFRALDQGVMLDLDGIGPETRGMLDRLESLGIRALPKFATDQFGLTNLYVVGYDEDPARTPAPIALSACGEACDPDRERALRKALLEFQAARVRKTFGHGPLTLADTVAPPGYVEAFIQKALPSLDLEESRALQAMLAWIDLSSAELRAVLSERVYSERGTKAFSELPTTPAPDGHARGRTARERLEEAGLDVLYVDCSPPDGGIGVVKAIVPGLEVETMSYYRIGERNTRKLIERDHPLIRFGTATDTLLPVRLTPEAIERFGGQPLFDVALAEEIVGSHYPLYREPESHHAPFRYERQGRRAERRTA
ncbi:YcaO-like family protein [Methylobacterium sp. B4]|uniref:YcaO-like family protein n=1 Tax=Methylobacterium sp. B4 TaxID=1938755 RepID=UPI000D77024D|nr:YcaO-like family protein [Methylobacterium sp. B4]PXW67055.1 ribosomal protein S12 methylthiotransferase accessory factor [Methylobacterium sp. B4]